MKVLTRSICILVTLTLSLFLPHFAFADYLGGITFDKVTPSYLPHGEQVTVSIDYKVDAPDGALIFARPFTSGSPTPGYGASGGDLVPTGSGTVEQNFSIYSGETLIDHVRVYMVSPDQSELYLELFVPAEYAFAPHGLFNIQMNYSQYSRLPYGRNLNISFDYASDSTENIRIIARPFTDGSITPGYGGSGSASLPPSGSYAQYFHFNQDADVTHVRYQIFNNDFSVVLYEFFLPFDVHWAEVGLYNISFDWPDGEFLQNSQDLTATFTVEHAETEDRYAWTWCNTDGHYSPGGVYQPSAPFSAGPQTISRYCRINSGEVDVDGVEFTYGLPTQVMMNFNVPVTHHYAPHAIQNHVFSPASPAIMSNGERLEMDFDYITDHGEEVRIYCRPAYYGDPLYGIHGAGSPAYPVPSGTGDFWLSFASGNHLANSMRFQMVSLDQSETFLEQFVPGWWAWGQSFQLTPAPDFVPTALSELGPVYPNPFNPTTKIPVMLTQDTHMQLKVYDLRGLLVQSLHDGNISAGEYLFEFRGEGQPSGVYYCRMETPMGISTRPMTLLK